MTMTCSRKKANITFWQHDQFQALLPELDGQIYRNSASKFSFGLDRWLHVGLDLSTLLPNSLFSENSVWKTEPFWHGESLCGDKLSAMHGVLPEMTATVVLFQDPDYNLGEGKSSSYQHDVQKMHFLRTLAFNTSIARLWMRINDFWDCQMTTQHHLTAGSGPLNGRPSRYRHNIVSLLVNKVLKAFVSSTYSILCLFGGGGQETFVVFQSI